VSAPVKAGDLYFRTGKSMIVPYSRRFSFSSDSSDVPIENVTVGPCPHMKLSQDAIFLFLLREQIGKKTGAGVVVAPAVYRSMIPYRDW
jgi:hypothetical protein